MPKKKRASKKHQNIQNLNVGDIVNTSGIANIAGGNISNEVSIQNITSGLSAAEIKQLFEQIYIAIESTRRTSPADKEDLKTEVREMQSTLTEAAQKNKKVNEGFLARRFRNIARMAPDVLDVVVATLGSPLAGLGVAVKKIAEKAKEETKAS